MTGTRLFLNVRQKLLHPDPTTVQTMSTFEMRPYGPSIEITDSDPDCSCISTYSPSEPEPNSATTLVDKNSWRENMDGDVKEFV